MKKWSGFLMGLCGLVVFSVLAQELGVPDEGEKITEITSDSLIFDYGEKLAVFTGNVVVTDPDMQLTTDKLLVYLTDDDEIRLIEARGNVVIKMEGLHSQSGKGVYTPGEGVLVLTEEPQVSREGSIMQAVKFTFFQFENRLKADGNVRLLNFKGPGEAGNE